MRLNYNGQTITYGGQLNFPATFSYSNSISIALYVKQSDIPVRKPKITEINTIPTLDEVGVSDWSTHALFYGGQGALLTVIQGFFITPTSTVTDPVSGQKLQQLNPTTDSTLNGPTAGLLGMSYGDVIWAYLQGRMNNPTTSMYLRTDPSSYIDPFGNQYNNPVIQQFESDYTVNISMQTFSMTLALEV